MRTDKLSGLQIAVIGSGISGLSAAWLLSTGHHVTLFEAEQRLGGHSNTVEAEGTPVDTGFIVYNEATYPNLTALFAHLGVATRASDMSFAVSLDDGALEYSCTGPTTLFAQARNIVSPRFWGMLADLLHFYRYAPSRIGRHPDLSLDEYLDIAGYGSAFRDQHLYPMAAAIWSTPAIDIGKYPAASFIRFCENHGLLRVFGRPVWRTVEGGSRNYTKLLAAPIANILMGHSARTVRRVNAGVEVVDNYGITRHFDHVVIAAHADQALQFLADASAPETRLLSAFRYSTNEAVLHNDPKLMPRRRRTWSSWNYVANGTRSESTSVTYWMNKLQGLDHSTPFFLTLNPQHEPDLGSVYRRISYRHPAFDRAAIDAQKSLWSLQGTRNTWFCGAYFGAGFHEDGLQAGLAVAEALGGVRRPWSVKNESDRIELTPLGHLAEAA